MNYQLNLNKKRKLTLNQKYHRFINRIDIWIRANITQRAHWLKISEDAIAYLDLDKKLELAVITLAKVYLNEELGKESSFTEKQKKDLDLEFYKGYRLHFVGDEKAIDICLEILDAYEATKISYKILRKLSADKRQEIKLRFTNALKRFVEERERFWT